MTPPKGWKPSPKTIANFSRGQKNSFFKRYSLDPEECRQQLALGNLCCTGCHRFVPISEAANKSQPTIDGKPHSCRCRACAKEDFKRYYEKNKEYNLARRREYSRQNKEEEHRRARSAQLASYGINQATYDAMLLEQGGVCAICRKPKKQYGRKRYLCVDHDHKTHAIRGLLCDTCNFKLGLLENGKGFIDDASAYLEKHGSWPLNSS